MINSSYDEMDQILYLFRQDFFSSLNKFEIFIQALFDQIEHILYALFIIFIQKYDNYISISIHFDIM